MKVLFRKTDVLELKYEEVKPFVKMARQQRVSFENPEGATWYGLKDEGELVSFYCLVIKGKTARFKSNYTVPAYRKNGALSIFIEHAKEKCLENNVQRMTAFCTDMSVGSHLRAGAKGSQGKNGITFVVYDVR